MKSIGYKQIIEYLEEIYDLEEALRRINRDTWHYAKRQMTWFAADKEIQWFAPESYNEIRTEVGKFLRENGLY
ncbi:MAG TPA: tRNA (adenosine(37)-N6)-dimethylallyltransferase MiaA, partial [Deltaproteobacteria bacterium]|nr:tRNA (adenosine(37)-N6)-dimethylallyltransferase MiaA [Deltaproteobacteria bacterium]